MALVSSVSCRPWAEGVMCGVVSLALGVSGGCERAGDRDTDVPGEASYAESLERMKQRYAGAHRDPEQLSALEAQLLEFLAERPRDAEAVMLLASVYLDQGRIEDASSTAVRSIKLDPELADGWLTLGVIEQTRGQGDRAALAYRKYLQLEPQGEHAGAVRAEVQRLTAPAPSREAPGAVDKKGVRAYVARRTAPLGDCYELYLLADPNLAGKMTITISIDMSGTVTHVVFQPGSLEHEQLRACMTDQIQQWRFPRAEEPADVTFSVVFSAE